MWYLCCYSWFSSFILFPFASLSSIILYTREYSILFIEISRRIFLQICSNFSNNFQKIIPSENCDVNLLRVYVKLNLPWLNNVSTRAADTKQKPTFYIKVFVFRSFNLCLQSFLNRPAIAKCVSNTSSFTISVSSINSLSSSSTIWHDFNSFLQKYFST